MSDESKYEELREELRGMTVKELRAYAREHLVSLGYVARKHEMVDEIVTVVRHQDMTEGAGANSPTRRAQNRRTM